MRRPTYKSDKHVLAVLSVLEWLGLVLITLATVIAIGQETAQIAERGKVVLQDILLLFIYLEILTMVGLYFSSGKLPLRYPIYIAIVAIARYIIIGMKDLNGWTLVALSGAILILAFATLAIRYGHVKFPYDDS